MVEGVTVTTTGEQLISLSSLSTGTALEHLLAITAGSGPGETIIVDSVDVQIEPGFRIELANDEIEVTVVRGIDVEQDGGINVKINDRLKVEV